MRVMNLGATTMLMAMARRPMVIGVVLTMSGSSDGEKLNVDNKVEGAVILF